MSSKDLAAVTQAAFEMGADGALLDPSDTDVLIYAAEWCDSTIDFDHVSPEAKRQIIDAYDRGTGL